MPGDSKLWTWLSRPENRSVLAFLGGGLTALAAAAWALFVYFFPAPARAPLATSSSPISQPPVPVPAPAAEAGDVQQFQQAQKNALAAETNALGNLAQQIQASGNTLAPAQAGSR